VKFNFQSKGTVIIGDSKFVGDNVSIVGGKVIIDGVEQSMDVSNQPQIDVTVYGDIKDIELGGGNLKCENVGGDVEVRGGNVTCNDIEGSVSSRGGNVTCGKVGGDVSSRGGNVIHR
jgi:hypothetical protein